MFLEQLQAQHKQLEGWNTIIDEMEKMKISNGQLKRENAQLEKRIEAGPQDADCSGASNKKLEEENRGLKDEITALLRYKSTTGDTLLELQTARGTMERELNQLKAELDEKKRNLEEMHQRFSGGEDTVRQLRE